jgi:hypothetical protein
MMQNKATGDFKTYWKCLKWLWITSDRRDVAAACFCFCTGVDHNFPIFSWTQLAVTDFRWLWADLEALQMWASSSHEHIPSQFILNPPMPQFKALSLVVFYPKGTSPKAEVQLSSTLWHRQWGQISDPSPPLFCWESHHLSLPGDGRRGLFFSTERGLPMNISSFFAIILSSQFFGYVLDFYHDDGSSRLFRNFGNYVLIFSHTPLVCGNSGMKRNFWDRHLIKMA